MDADSRSLVHSSQLSLFAAEAEVSRLSGFITGRISPV
jgi:hypothetical protein